MMSTLVASVIIIHFYWLMHWTTFPSGVNKDGPSCSTSEEHQSKKKKEEEKKTLNFLKSYLTIEERSAIGLVLTTDAPRIPVREV